MKHLLELASINNASKSITGMRLYCNSHFIQLLEGNEADLLALFNIIAGDNPHTDVQKVLTGEMAAPQFPDWSMDNQFLTEAQLKNLEKNENIDIANYIRQAKNRHRTKYPLLIIYTYPHLYLIALTGTNSN